MAARMNVEQHADALAANLPSGRVWIPKMIPTSNLRKLLRGLAPTFEMIDALLQRYVDQSVPTETEDYLAEWEAALGIPDPCIPLESDTLKRQRNIEIKLAILGGVQTKADFEYLGSLFSMVVEVNAGIDHVAVVDGGYGTKTPVLDIPTDFATLAVARNSIVVVETLPDEARFPYNFPIPFTTSEQLQLRCLFERLKQANSQIVYVTGP